MAAPDPAQQLFKDSSCTGGGVHTCLSALATGPPAMARRGSPARLGQHGIPLGLDSLDLFDQELEPVELPADLGLQAVRKGATIARDQRLKPLATVSVQGLVVADPLGEQKPLDAIDVPDPFGCQGLALPTDPAPILLLGVGALTIAQTRGSPRL
jgi:hypothetical protein